MGSQVQVLGKVAFPSLAIIIETGNSISGLDMTDRYFLSSVLQVYNLKNSQASIIDCISSRKTSL